MRKLILITLLLLSITPCLMAQRKEMSQARSYIKSGKDFDKAEKLMRELLAKDSLNRLNPKIHLLLYQSIYEQYDAGNEKLYLNQKYDTASLFNLTKSMFSVLETLDSIDAMPDKKGRVKPEYRRKHAAELNTYRPNLYYGGTYNLTKAKYDDAFGFFDMYLDCVRQPIFTGYDYAGTDTLMASAAYWATYCGYKQNNPDHTLKYAQQAMADTSKLQFTLRFMAEAYGQKKDSANYLKMLSKGFTKYPHVTYFFPKLMDYYTANNKLDSALTLANRALETDGKSLLFLFAKSTVLLNLGKYEECVAVSDTMIAINDTLPDAYLNAGMAYLNRALVLENKPNPKEYRSQTRKLYEQARPYMEKYRMLAPDAKDKWAPALYRVYLNLNMGKQFEEIDKTLKSSSSK